MVGLYLTPEGFTPPAVDVDFDREGNPEGVYWPDDWENDAPATILEAISEMPRDRTVLIAIWNNGSGHVSVVGSDEITLSPDDPEPFAGVDWSRATPDAEPRWIREHPSRAGVSLVLVDEHPPVDPGSSLDTSGLHGLRDALDELLYDLPFEVLVRDYADGADFPPGDELTSVFGVSPTLKRISIANGRLTDVPGASKRGNAGPYDWYLLSRANAVTGHVLRVRQGIPFCEVRLVAWPPSAGNSSLGVVAALARHCGSVSS